MSHSRRGGHWRGRVWAACLAMLVAPSASAQPGFPGWVGLYAPSRLAWLENENRISELCSNAPDLYLQDFGYGPYFHQTFVRRQGDWFLLPRNPWATEVWLHRPGEQAQASVIDVQAGDIIELNGEGMVVVAAESDALSLCSEQPADLWCEEGDPPALVAVTPSRLTRPELLDGDGHLVIRPKYLKGC